MLCFPNKHNGQGVELKTLYLCYRVEPKTLHFFPWIDLDLVLMPLQGPGGPEADPPADPTQPQCVPPGESHSFVQDHFQAQYKSVSHTRPKYTGCGTRADGKISIWRRFHSAVKLQSWALNQDHSCNAELWQISVVIGPTRRDMISGGDVSAQQEA